MLAVAAQPCWLRSSSYRRRRLLLIARHGGRT